MKGTFKITLDHLRELGACLEGQREFKRAFPDGGGYQEVLDRCAEEGRIDFAIWLFSKIGPTEDVGIFENEILDENKKLFFAGSMDFKQPVFVRYIFAGDGIRAGCSIEAGDGIRAGWGIRAGKGIRAGWGIRAGKGIEAGEGIRAGLRIQAGESIEAGKGIDAGESIQAGLRIQAGESIEAGKGIDAGESIQAGESIRAGWGIRAGKGIRAGDDFSVFAGLNVRTSLWEKYAVVSASEKPKNLRSGFWVPQK